jgi:hypothetical protein
VGHLLGAPGAGIEAIPGLPVPVPFRWGHQFDFFDFDLQIAIEVQGLYWHYEFQKAQAVNDQLRKIRAEVVGYTLIFIDEDHAWQTPSSTCGRPAPNGTIPRGYRSQYLI